MAIFSLAVRREATSWIKLSIPATLRGISENLPTVLALIFVGRLGTGGVSTKSLCDLRFVAINIDSLCRTRSCIHL